MVTGATFVNTDKTSYVPVVTLDFKVIDDSNNQNHWDYVLE